MNLRTLFILVIFISGLNINAANLRVGIEASSKPFAYKTSDDKLAGFDVDIANAICAELKTKCSFIEQEWKGIIPGLLTRKYDAIISSMSITEERKKSVDFTSKYYQTPPRLIAKLSSKLAGTPESLAGKKVGVLQGSTQEAYANEIFKKAGANVVSYATQNEVFLDLKAGRLDATLVDSVQGQESFLATDTKKEYAFVGPVYKNERIFGQGAGIAVRKGEAELRDRINVAIQTIRNNGTYKKIQDKYFDFDVYGQ